jgi:AcrR family transcriptional regulator
MKKGERRKQELLNIAYKMFISRGYENTSVDNIIEAAGIAKGTYYYYFESKEQTLEEVIGMMIDAEAEKAKVILNSDAPVPQKLVGIIASFRPQPDEMPIGDALNRPENVLMHDKVNRRIIEKLVPIISELVEEGKKEGIFDCENVPERVRMILIISNTLFDDFEFTGEDIEVFIELIEKLLGAKPGTMDFIRGLIGQG